MLQRLKYIIFIILLLFVWSHLLHPIEASMLYVLAYNSFKWNVIIDNVNLCEMFSFVTKLKVPHSSSLTLIETRRRVDYSCCCYLAISLIYRLLLSSIPIDIYTLILILLLVSLVGLVPLILIL